MKIAAYQCNSQQIKTPADKRQFLEKLPGKVKKFHAREAFDMLVLPELSTLSYERQALEQLDGMAEPLQGKSFSVFSSMARALNIHVVYGIPREEAGHYFISQVVVGPDGDCKACYDKIHIAQFGVSIEKEFFTRGQKASVFEAGGFQFGLAICYDFRFAEFLKYLAEDQGADVILHPCAFTTDGTFYSWHAFAITRAMENQVYFLSVNRAGKEWGNTILCPPWADENNKPMVLGKGEGIGTIEITADKIKSARETYPFRDDRLGEYGEK